MILSQLSWLLLRKRHHDPRRKSLVPLAVHYFHPLESIFINRHTQKRANTVMMTIYQISAIGLELQRSKFCNAQVLAERTKQTSLDSKIDEYVRYPDVLCECE